MAKEKRQFGFFKTVLLGALLVVVPIGIVGFALWQVFVVTRDLIGPVFEALPFESSFIRVLLIISVILLVVLLCYFTGLAVRTRWGGRLRTWIERRFLERIPGYSVVRSVAHQYLGQEGEEKFRPVMVDLYGSGTRQVGFEIEEVDGATVAVFLPSAPAVTLGQVYFVPRSRVFPIDASMHDAIETVATFGVGAAKLAGGEKLPAEGDG